MDCLSRPIVMSQGSSIGGSILLTQGPTLEIERFDGSIASLKSGAACLPIGAKVHVIGKTECCQSHEGTYLVEGRPGETELLLTPIDTPPLPKPLTAGWMAQAINLRGLYLAGIVASRRVQNSKILASACISAGSNRVLMMGNVPVAIGDNLAFPAAGIPSAIVTGVFDATGSSGSSNGCCADNSKGSRDTVVTLSVAATVSVSCDVPRAAEMSGRVLAQFSFQRDLTTGRASYTLDSIELAQIPVPSSDCGAEPYLVGCYEIALFRGAAPDFSDPNRPVPRWRRAIASGEFYLRSSLF